MSALDELARKLGLLQTPSRDAALEWASRCRELTDDGTALDQAAIVAAKNVFPTEFRPVQYKHADPQIETLLEEIEKFGGHDQPTGKIMPTWRAEFFANREGDLPSRYLTIEASDENDALDQAAGLMSTSEMRVDVHRTFVKK
jgi:hypothetical protein